jgi:hypothetical protein
MKPTIFGPKLWLCIASAKSYEASASSAQQSIALYCDTSNINYNSISGVVSICPRLEERHKDAQYLVFAGNSMRVAANADSVAYTSSTFLIEEGTKKINLTFSGSGNCYFSSYQAQETMFYLTRVTLTLYKSDGTFLKSVTRGPLAHSRPAYKFNTGAMSLEYECNLGDSETAYYYFIVTTERYSPTAVDFVVSGAQGHHSIASTICEGSWGNIIGTLSDTVKVAGEVHYAILDNYIRPD